MAREKWIDAAKGAAIFGVVLGHFFASADTSQLLVGREINHFIYSFHMVLFFMVSGYLSKTCVLNIDTLVRGKEANSHKLKRCFAYVIRRETQLLVPLLFFALLNLWLPRQSLWFIPVLMFVSCVIPTLKVFMPDHYILTLLLIFWGLSGIVNNTVCVLIGYTLAFEIGNYLKILKSKISYGKLLAYNGVFFLSLGIYFIMLFLHYHLFFGNLVTNGYFKVLMGIPGSYCILTVAYCVFQKHDCPPLTDLGRFTLPIYFLHPWIMGAMLSKLEHYSINMYLIGVVTVAFSCIIPILVYQIFIRIPVLNFIFQPVQYLEHTRLWRKVMVCLVDSTN